jgi:3-dehydro-4-phosphotetronate decarboxylase
MSEQLSESQLRQALVEHGASLFARGYCPGSSGNLSVRLDDGYLFTPTNACLGRLDPQRLAKLDADGRHISGDKPTKEVPLHMAFYESRPQARSVVHLHSPWCVALSCLADVDPANVLPPLTPYFIMRVGKLPLAPYHRPGDTALGQAVRQLAAEHAVVLLANHGPVVSGSGLDAAVWASEELEATAQLFFALRGHRARLLDARQVRELL